VHEIGESAVGRYRDARRRLRERFVQWIVHALYAQHRWTRSTGFAYDRTVKLTNEVSIEGDGLTPIELPASRRAARRTSCAVRQSSSATAFRTIH